MQHVFKCIMSPFYYHHPSFQLPSFCSTQENPKQLSFLLKKLSKTLSFCLSSLSQNTRTYNHQKLNSQPHEEAQLSLLFSPPSPSPPLRRSVSENISPSTHIQTRRWEEQSDLPGSFDSEDGRQWLHRCKLLIMYIWIFYIWENLLLSLLLMHGMFYMVFRSWWDQKFVTIKMKNA